MNVEPLTLPGQGSFFDQPFPRILQCQTPGATLPQTVDWVSAEREALEQQAAEYGAVLFRGFPLATAEDFDAFIAASGWTNFPYEESLSNAVRVNRTERVFTANEAPPEVTIYLHHEMAQTPVFPSKLFFFCEKPADTGGATPLCRSDALVDRMREATPQFLRDCEEKGLKYSNVMPAEADLSSGMGRTWQSTFRAENREEAEARMAALNYSWEWSPDGSLRATTPVLPAVRKLANGRMSFFNQLIAASHWQDLRNDPSKAITHGDGAPLDQESVSTAAEIADEITFNTPWEAGDVALVDNFVTMHGRRTFSGVRKILASLVQ